jgi:hypothetical protein
MNIGKSSLFGDLSGYYASVSANASWSGPEACVPAVDERKFLIDVVASGSVLGVGMGDTPDQVAERLGGGFLEDTTRLTMRRDYGLVEFFWSRRSRRDPWLSAGFAVQVHRLAVDPALRDGPWGTLGPRVPFAGLRADLTRLGFHCREITAEADRPQWRRYWHEESLVSVLVVRTSRGADPKPGDVYAIHAPHTQATVAADQMRGRRQSFRDSLVHLVRLDDAGRQAWLDRREPAPPNRVNWWLYLMLVIDSRLQDQPGSRPEWVDLRLWLMHQALARGIFSKTRYAGDMAYFVRDMRLAQVTSPGLPRAEDVVRACLDAITGTPDQAVARDDDGHLTTFDRAILLPSWRARTLVNAAQWHLDAVGDEILAGRLREWIAVRQWLA